MTSKTKTESSNSFAIRHHIHWHFDDVLYILYSKGPDNQLCLPHVQTCSCCRQNTAAQLSL